MARSGIMLCYPFEEKRLEKWNPPYLVQPKFDGERCRAKWSPIVGWKLISSEENIFSSVPHINSALNDSSIPVNIELDGELYLHGLDFSDIHSIVGRTVNIHPDHQDIEYHIFDIVDGTRSQFERTQYLLSLNLKPPLKHVATEVANSLEDILSIYDRFVAKDYEGIIVRHIDNVYIRRRSTYVMKFKPKKSDFYRVIGYKEEISKDGLPKGRLGALICVGDDGTEFSVGSGLTEEARNNLWNVKNTLAGRFCHVQYQHITSGKGVPRFPVYVSISEEEDRGEMIEFNPLIEGGDNNF